jgi:hypothetical protein
MVDPPDQGDVFDGLFGNEQGRPAPRLDSRRAAPEQDAVPAPPPAGALSAGLKGRAAPQQAPAAPPAPAPSGAPGDPINSLFRAETVLSAPPVEEGPSETELLRWKSAARPSLFEAAVRDPAPPPAQAQPSAPPTELDLDDHASVMEVTSHTSLDLDDEVAAMSGTPSSSLELDEGAVVIDPKPDTSLDSHHAAAVVDPKPKAKPAMPLPPLPAAPMVGDAVVHDPAPPVAPAPRAKTPRAARKRPRKRRRRVAQRGVPWKLIASIAVVTGSALAAAWILWPGTGPGAGPGAMPSPVASPQPPKPAPADPKLFESPPEADQAPAQLAANPEAEAKKPEAAAKVAKAQAAAKATPAAKPEEPAKVAKTQAPAKAAPEPSSKKADSHASLLIRARRLRADDEPEQAEALARQVLAANPREHHAMVELARALIDQDRGKEAAAQMKKAVAKRRKRVSYRLLYGDALLMAGDQAGAKLQWQVAYELAPTHKGVKQRLGL